MSVANPLNPSDALKQGCWKRKGTEEDGEDTNTSVKKAKTFWYVLESESPQPTSSDEDESIYSIQEQETEFVQDTSDTSTNTWVTSGDEVMHVEYEPASPSSNENPFIDCLSSSDPEIPQHIVRYAIAAAICDSDLDLADDSNDSSTSRDSEISHRDYWTCVQCKNNNNNPLFRYCEKCYQERKLFLPPRPRGKRRRKPSKKRARRVRALEGQESLSSQDSALGSSIPSQTNVSFELKRLESSEKSLINRLSGQSTSCTTSLSQDSGFSSSLSQTTSSLLSQPCTSFPLQEGNTMLNVKNDLSREKTPDETELSYGSQDSQNSLATTLSVSDKNDDLSDSSDDKIDFAEKIRLLAQKAKLQNENENKNCLGCTVARLDGIFVHGLTSHICCCYRCTIRVWKTTRRCPMCNRRLTSVIKAYYS